MKLSLNWLKEYIDINTKTPEQLAEKLTLSGTSVDSIGYQADKYQNIIVAQIQEVKPHPNADKLRLAIVSDGKKTRQIVCGAPNIKVGQKVPLVFPGAKLPSGLEVKEVEIRGQKSEGMLCSQRELGLGDDHSGILILDEKAKIGESIVKILGLDDVIFELALTPNRGDCLSILGIAREVAAINPKSHQKQILNSKFKILNKFQVSSFKFQRLKIEVKDIKLCPKYCALVIKNVKVSESPEWLKRRLVSVGIRPINNIVDITNYVMMETGQPLHAFDMYKLKAQSSKLKATTQNSKLIIGVRRAKKGEGIITLDGQNRQLDETMLVITDGQKPIAVAGVMGGANSEVSEQTKDIILEAAIFNPVSVRQTAKKLGVRTEASLRFERGIDWFLPEKTLMKAGEMVRELSGGEVLSEIFKKQVDDPRPIEIRVKLDYINQLLGHNFRAIEVKAILGRLGFIVSLSRCFINVRVPSWRNDVKIPADIAEEVGRIFDYNKLKSQPIKAVLHPPKLNLIYEFKSKVREALKSLGYNEVYSYSFYGEKEARCSEMDIVNHFEVLNPISPEQRYLRTSLSPLLLENSSMNLRFFDNVKIFEIGRVFYPPSLKAMKAMGDLATSPSITMEYLPIEEERLTGIVSLNKKSVQEIYRLVKGDIEVMFKELGVKEVRWEIEKFKVQSSKFKVKVKGQTIKKEIIDLGDVSILSEKDKEDYKIRLEVVVFDFSISNLLKTADNYSPYVPVPSFPEMKRDLSFIVPTTVRYQDLINNIQKYSSLIRDICLIDEFYLPTGERSLTLRITYRSEEKTLISKEVEEIEQKIILSLEKKLGVRIRS